MRVTVKPTAAQTTKHEVEAEPGTLVQELKAQLVPLCSIPAPEQRLIYKGQILKGAQHGAGAESAWGDQCRACRAFPRASTPPAPHHDPCACPRADERTLDSYGAWAGALVTWRCSCLPVLCPQPCLPSCPPCLQGYSMSMCCTS